MENVDLNVVRNVITIFAVLFTVAGSWFYMKFKVEQIQKDIEENQQEDKERELRIMTRLAEMDTHFDEQINNLRESLKLLFKKNDRNADTFGDIRVVLTQIVSTMSNPHPPKEILDSIRDIGKAKNGR